ncbi:hypothetical protein PoMZ_04321 [Pyricularia oryzae]|uniref:Uncharacterized protein n=1 Tax=Pyricularia oryzae TaxID=318829 RepID=A0A4P7NDN1_PYROR|nr:hypothetical protein PoMZ_04321 [Pyricularia oryzae]
MSFLPSSKSNSLCHRIIQEGRSVGKGVFFGSAAASESSGFGSGADSTTEGAFSAASDGSDLGSSGLGSSGLGSSGLASGSGEGARDASFLSSGEGTRDAGFLPLGENAGDAGFLPLGEGAGDAGFSGSGEGARDACFLGSGEGVRDAGFAGSGVGEGAREDWGSGSGSGSGTGTGSGTGVGALALLELLWLLWPDDFELLVLFAELFVLFVLFAELLVLFAELLVLFAELLVLFAELLVLFAVLLVLFAELLELLELRTILNLRCSGGGGCSGWTAAKESQLRYVHMNQPSPARKTNRTEPTITPTSVFVGSGSMARRAITAASGSSIPAPPLAIPAEGRPPIWCGRYMEREGGGYETPRCW